MQHPAWVVAPLALVAVLGFSATTKLGRGETLRTIVRNLELPDWVLPRPLARAIPGLELVLAVFLLAPSRFLFTAAAVATLGLMLVYWALIARGLTLTPRPQCGCFGQVGDQSISGRTLARNTVLVAAAVATVALGASGRTAWSLWDGSDNGDLLWLALTAGACVLTALVLGGRQGQADEVAHPPAAVATEPASADADDYVRTPTPHLVVHDVDLGQPVTLQELAKHRAQLLVFVNCYCASTKEVMADITAWDERNPLVDVRLVFSVPIAEKFVGPPPARTLLDHRGIVWEALGLRGSPTAVLLGVDDHLAGGPVSGSDDVRRFVDDVEEALREATTSTEATTEPAPVLGEPAEPAEPAQPAEPADTLGGRQLTGDR
ncbi:MauE/DoxX family redox-associated membrane protein [Knoellia sp. CPCC 206450]|uniref:MauE/DoxX family redox-associated membrane protein n=1 Tax=Knoellia tibetensis TaxID=3404798 RepID=UPI003B43C030